MTKLDLIPYIAKILLIKVLQLEVRSYHGCVV